MSSTKALLQLVPQITLLGSIIAYPLLFCLVTPRNATASRFTKSREAISVLHCTLVTLASAYELQRRFKDWGGSSTSSSFTGSDNPVSGLDAELEGSLDGNVAAANLEYGANSPLITTRSILGNSIAALEMGYLVQDAVILILAARLRARDAGGRGKSLVKEIDWRVLGWHHAGFSSALGALQWSISQGKEKGIMVILMFMLMNASTPVGTLHWYLVNFQPSRRKEIMATNALYLMIHGIFRVSVIGWILHVMGSQTGHSAAGAFLRLRTSCRLGTATIGIANLIWFILGVRKFARRYQGDATWRKSI